MLILLFCNAFGAFAMPSTSRTTAKSGVKMAIAENYGKLPLRFDANQGQTAREVKFLSRGPGYALFLTARNADCKEEMAQARLTAAMHNEALLRDAPKSGAQLNPLCLLRNAQAIL